ncbi:hypothetical protein [Wolbachia endosymbiont of Frankliniella intonsa]|uniref:hypothetical protein n=1 Tax=Wolbachia endosymbiont of Frankliniella intonsa TaxID=2902422 RepID=UPI00397A30E1
MFLICSVSNGFWYKTPMQTFFDSMHIAYQKNIDSIKQDADFGFDFVNSSVR